MAPAASRRLRTHAFGLDLCSLSHPPGTEFYRVFVSCWVDEPSTAPDWSAIDAANQSGDTFFLAKSRLILEPLNKRPPDWVAVDQSGGGQSYTPASASLFT